MAKNGFKMVEIFLGTSHMICNNIFNIFCFLIFSFWYFLDLVFRAIFSKFGQNTGFVKYPKEKVEKQKMLKMLSFVIYEAPKKISTIFKPFLAIFTLIHFVAYQCHGPDHILKKLQGIGVRCVTKLITDD